jgi:hypothetical protein
MRRFKERHSDLSQAAIQAPSNGSARFFRIVIKWKDRGVMNS